jgi:hypothetical protein
MAESKKSKKRCMKCENDNLDEVLDFYQHPSSLYTDQRFPVCKDCLEASVDSNSEHSIVTLMRMIDRPFLHEEWRACLKDDNPFRKYMRRLAMKQNRQLTWDDSTHSRNISRSNEVELNFDAAIKDEFDITQEDANEMMKFWGKGFEMEDYMWLQVEYEDFTNRYECDSKGMEMLIKQICLTELDIEYRRTKKEKVDTQLKTLQELLGSSNLKPVQETGANAAEQESFGTLIKKYENEKPIPEAEKKWKDVDEIGRYVRVFFLGHLSRMLGLNNEYADEYWDEINKHTVEQTSEDEEREEYLENGIS